MKSIASTLLRFAKKLRGSGTSTLIHGIAHNYNCYVLVANEAEKKRFGSGSISLTDISSEKLRVITVKPLLIDNYAFIQLMEEIVDEQNKQEDIIRELTAKLKKYEQLN